MPGVSSTFKTGHTRGNGDTGHKARALCPGSSPLTAAAARPTCERVQSVYVCSVRAKRACDACGGALLAANLSNGEGPAFYPCLPSPAATTYYTGTFKAALCPVSLQQLVCYG